MKKHCLSNDIKRPPRSMYFMNKALFVLQYIKATTVNVLYEKAISRVEYFKATTVNLLYDKALSVLR